MSDPSSPRGPDRRAPWDRRRLSAALAASLVRTLVPTESALAGPERMLRWIADVDGDGRIDASDRKLLVEAVRAQRGFEIEPAEGYDYRADLMARARVDARDLRAWQRLTAGASGHEVVRRPITVAWHYGWYHRRKRTARQTCKFLGGNYLSDDPATEDRFHRLKNECGISVDALGWISPRVDRRTVRNFQRGYLASRRLRSRHAALLYESRINLPRDSERIAFDAPEVRQRLIEDFGLMANWFRQLNDRGGRPFLLDGRPVIFLYASHTYVQNTESAVEGRLFGDTIEAAIERFHRTYGDLPFLVGEELPLGPQDDFGADRQMRGANFDGAFAYHHAAHPTNIIHGGRKLGAGYARRQQQLLERAVPAVRDVRNRFTDREVLLVPSLAAGFAKNGYRKLLVSRASYANYLRDMHAYLDEAYYSAPDFRAGPFRTPVYTVGSWNEEFEGHALFPFAFNRSLPRTAAHGFDLALALKEVFGWNVYARRPIE